MVQRIDHDVGGAGMQPDTVAPANGQCPAILPFDHPAPSTVRKLGVNDLVTLVLRRAIVLGRPVIPGDQRRHQRDNRVVVRVDKAGGNHRVMILDSTATPLAYRTVGTADCTGNVLLGTVNGQEIAPVLPLETGHPTPTLASAEQGREHRPQGLRVDKVEAFPHGRVARYTVDAEKPPEVAVQLRVDPVPAGIGVKIEEGGVFQLEHR